MPKIHKQCKLPNKVKTYNYAQLESKLIKCVQYQSLNTKKATETKYEG